MPTLPTWNNQADPGNIGMQLVLDSAESRSKIAMIFTRQTFIDRMIQGDALEMLKVLPDKFVQCIVTSPPYWGLRDYGSDGQIGLEPTPGEYVDRIVSTFREARRVLKDDGTLWLNLGDSYASTKEGNTNGLSGKVKQKAGVNDDKRKRTIPPGLKPKDLVGIPWRVAFALQADGWYLRSDIIWHKPNTMPESVTDRPTKSHEYIFLLSKHKSYYYDADAIKEKSVYDDPRMVDGFVPKSVNGKHADDPQNSAHRKQYKPTEAGGGTSMVGHNGYFKSDGTPIGTPGMRNKRDVWTVTTSPYPDAHFATFPDDLIVPCIKAGSPQGGGSDGSVYGIRHDGFCSTKTWTEIPWNRIKSRIY